MMPSVTDIFKAIIRVKYNSLLMDIINVKESPHINQVAYPDLDSIKWPGVLLGWDVSPSQLS